jgi:hypothetical protein
MRALAGIVRDLDWIAITDDDCDFETVGSIWRFWVLRTDKGFLTVRDTTEIGTFPALAEAFTAAQADHTARVLAAIDTALLWEAVSALEKLAYLQGGNPCTGIQSERWLSDARAALAKLKGDRT